MQKLQYYIKSILLSFFGLVVVSAISIFIEEHTPESYEYVGIGFAYFVMMIGVIFIGYSNASLAFKEQRPCPIYLHAILVIGFFITDIAFDRSDFLIIILRNFAYFIFLQLGAYLYIKRKTNNGI